jgi:methionyl-tRNA formyltransferase
MTPLRIIFMGTAPLAAASLEALLTRPEWDVVTVVTQPDRPKGRDLKLQPSAVKELALGRSLPVLQPEKARNEDFIRQLRALEPDLIVVAAYGQILPSSILDLPRFQCLNVHASLLPKYRGAAPIQWAILNGDARTGVTIMKMEASLDTGPILTQETTPISDDDTAQTVHDRLAALGAGLLVRTIPGYVGGQIPPRPQPAEGVSYARKITREDGHLDWSLPAPALRNRVRGLVPWPGASSLAPSASGPLLLKFWQAVTEESSGGPPGEILAADKHGLLVACGQGALRVLVLQREGGRRMSVPEFLAGHPLRPGQHLLPVPAPAPVCGAIPNPS